MSQNLLLTKVSGRYGTALFGTAKIVSDRYGSIVSEVEEKCGIERRVEKSDY